MTTKPQPADLVRRYACFTFEDGVYEHPQGQHVAYADYEKAAERIKELERERRELLAANDGKEKQT